MLFMIKNVYTLWLFLMIINCFSQNTLQSNLKVNARAQKDRILLRWAIDTPIEWQKAQKSGFIVNRFVIKRDGKMVNPPEKMVLTSAPLLADPLESWMELIQKDNYAAIIAQAIFGDSFDVG